MVPWTAIPFCQSTCLNRRALKIRITLQRLSKIHETIVLYPCIPSSPSASLHRTRHSSRKTFSLHWLRGSKTQAVLRLRALFPHCWTKCRRDRKYCFPPPRWPRWTPALAGMSQMRDAMLTCRHFCLVLTGKSLAIHGLSFTARRSALTRAPDLCLAAVLTASLFRWTLNGWIHRSRRLFLSSQSMMRWRTDFTLACSKTPMCAF